jgi:hypothetical protein
LCFVCGEKRQSFRGKMTPFIKHRGISNEKKLTFDVTNSPKKISNLFSSLHTVTTNITTLPRRQLRLPWRRIASAARNYSKQNKKVDQIEVVTPSVIVAWNRSPWRWLRTEELGRHSGVARAVLLASHIIKVENGLF